MFKLLTALLLSVFATGAYATGGHHNHKPAPAAVAVAEGGDSSAKSTANSESESSSRSTSNSKSASDASANSENTNTANGGAGGTATNAGNSQSTSFTAPKSPVNTAVSGIGETTAGCRFHNGGGLQLMGVGLSLGNSRKDKDCERIALAQLMWARGQDIAGDRIMCKVTTVAEALGEDCLALVNQLKPAADTEAKAEYVTPTQLGEVEKRIVNKLVTK